MDRTSLPVRGGWVGVLAVAVLAAVVTGAVLAADDEVATHPPETTPPDDTPTPAAPSADPTPREYLVWGHGGVTDEVLAALRSYRGVVAVSVVNGDRLDIDTVVDERGATLVDHEEGWAIPLDAQAFDVDAHEPFVAAETATALRRLGPGKVVLGRTSARLRGVDVGATLVTTDGDVLEVVGVVDDKDIGWAEAAVDTTSQLGIDEPRYALVEVTDGSGLEAAVEAASSEEVRVKPTREAPFRRHGDETLPPVVLKERFGEFAFADVRGPGIRVGASWRNEHVVTEDVPILGRITCHEAMMPAVRDALQSLRDDGLEHLVQARTYGGCWHPRVIGSSRTLSHHSWGVSIDLNVIAGDPFGAELDPRLIEAFTDRGFIWGGEFLRADPVHFDFVGEALTDR
jgi:hypothetical protein